MSSTFIVLPGSKLSLDGRSSVGLIVGEAAQCFSAGSLDMAAAAFFENNPEFEACIVIPYALGYFFKRNVSVERLPWVNS